MSDQALVPSGKKPAAALKKAVYRNRAASRQGLLERLFAMFFDNLVYPQIWEDPRVDMRAMAIRPGQHVVAIASGGCNVLSYLAADPGRITAVDLNPAHLALTRLKLTAARHLRSFEEFRRFFADADSQRNTRLYHHYLETHLDDDTRRYWSGSDLFGRRRITMFERNFYRYGMLGYFILLAHGAARLYGVRPAEIMDAANLEDQRAFFDTQLSGLFDKRLVRWITSSPVSLYGLGIPPAQYSELAEGRHMADVLRERLERLACDHLLADNYFARQAFGRAYGPAREAASLPPYLEAENWQSVRSRADRVMTVNASVTDVLASSPAASVDRFVLLDAQDWMSNEQMNDLWRAITRAAAPEARVIFRTAAGPSPLEQRIDPGVLSRWRYDAGTSQVLGAEDRSAIYGGFHLYRLAP